MIQSFSLGWSNEKTKKSGRHDSVEYVLPTVSAPPLKVNFGMCLEHKVLPTQAAESGFAKSCMGCDPVSKSRGNPKFGSQWLPETAGSRLIGTVCSDWIGFLGNRKSKWIQPKTALNLLSSESLLTEIKPSGLIYESRDRGNANRKGSLN
jgi:hypothetical protein